MDEQLLKTIWTLGGAAAVSFAAPVVPFAAVCTAAVVADCVSAVMLSRRVRRKVCAGGRSGVTAAGKVSSRRLGAAVTSLIKVYAALLLAHGVDVVIVPSLGDGCLRFVAGAVCFWQVWSVLENEASANDAPWARVAQKFLVDKAERHLGVELDGLRDAHKLGNPGSDGDTLPDS